MKGPIDKICGHCGQTFACGGYGCWCGQVPLTERQFDWIAQRYDNCLCSICLQKISNGELGVISDTDRGPDG
jgi:hypothetical protein